MRVIKRKQFEGKLEWLSEKEFGSVLAKIYKNIHEIKIVVQSVKKGNDVKGYIIPVMSDTAEKDCLIIDTEYESIFKLNGHLRSIDSEKCIKESDSIITLSETDDKDIMNLVLSQNIHCADVATKYTHKYVEYYMICAKNQNNENNLRVLAVIELPYPESMENKIVLNLTTKISFPKILL